VKAAAFPPTNAWRGRVSEAAPARARIRVIAWALVLVFLGLAARAAQLAFSADPAAKPAVAAAPAALARADLVDRNGVLLATTLPSYALVVEPARAWNPAETARRLAAMFPDIDADALSAKLQEKRGGLVYAKRGLSPRQRDAAFALGLAGVSFREEPARVYPNGVLAAHLLGGVNAGNRGAGGVESGLDAEILRGGAEGKPVRLSIDVRAQHALEAELDAAVAVAHAEGGAGIVLAGRTGEVLAIASAPTYDPNDPPPSDDARRLNRAAGAVYEMGSSLKPFTVAMGLEAGLTRPDEVFDLTRPLVVEGFTIQDFHGLNRLATLSEAFAESSNIMAAQMALRVGAPRQRATLRRLGLYDRAPIETPETARPLTQVGEDPLSVAVLGYGHGMAFSLAALAGAYTVFANDGARVKPTLLARAPGDPIQRIPVFSKATTQAVLAMMRRTVVAGTGRRANVPGLEIAGKTGSAEKPHKGVYEPDVLFSSFAAVFPASNPRYVVIVALDEPRRTPDLGNLATGGAVAAPAVGRIAARLAALGPLDPPERLN
jgi:cell division protein FtsI (penicillin-binding protein 3)